MKKLLMAVGVLAGVGLWVPARASAQVFFGFNVPGVSLFVGAPVGRSYYQPPAYYAPPVVYRPPIYYYPPVPVAYERPCHRGYGGGWGRHHGRHARGWDD